MQRRQFIGALGVTVAGSKMRSGLETTLLPRAPELPAGASPSEWRRHFPALRQSVNGKPLVYLDTAASSLRPAQVIDAIAEYYRLDNANPGASLHTLARRSAESYESARRTAANFINAGDPSEIIFTRGTTEGINLVAGTWAAANLRSGDNLLIGLAEHASNMAPWQAIARRTGAEVRYFGISDSGHPVLDDLESKLDVRTKVVAFSHVSNVLGMINPAREMCARAKAPGRIVFIDAAQSVPHFAVDVRELGCDFLAFSGHKMLGPMGVGVLWGRRELLDVMPPYQSGSNMAHDVELESMHVSEGALKFGAGTPNVSGAIGLAAAMRFLRSAGAASLWRHEQEITRHVLRRLGAIRGIRLLGSTVADEKISVFAFSVNRARPEDALRALDQDGIAVRAGDLASLPLLRRLGTTRAIRASCYLYTRAADVDSFADALEDVATGGDS
jgi:cysteine desulfurase/selenocysteine lyase